jgi:D-amino-acid dehydrogenase
MKIAVIGCGLVGLACAHALADEGHAVTLIDREGAAAGASQGNAGWLAHTDILPVASPKIWRMLPSLITDPLGPLTVRPSYLPTIMPWLVRFLAACSPAAIDHSIAAMAALQVRALPAWQSLAKRLDLGTMIHQRGGLYVFDDLTAFAAAKPIYDRQRGYGMTVDLLEAHELRQMEPALSTIVKAAAYFPDAAHVADPRDLTLALFARAKARGIAFRRSDVTALEVGAAQVRLIARQAEAIVADSAVVAAGAWSRPLALSLGERVPLDTERGYNVSFKGAHPLARPLSFEGHGFVVTPLDSGLRIGGAVEFGGLVLPPNHARTRALYTKASRLIDDLPPFENGEVWMGFRPSLPDSLPVIGPSRRSAKIVYAFGHGHYGLTQSALTGQIVAALLAGRPAPLDLTPYRADRFAF